jgi:hypothetical protein
MTLVGIRRQKQASPTREGHPTEGPPRHFPEFYAVVPGGTQLSACDAHFAYPEYFIRRLNQVNRRCLMVGQALVFGV